MSVILVVDDEEDIRELVGIYLKNEGMQVCKAANGKEALHTHAEELWKFTM